VVPPVAPLIWRTARSPSRWFCTPEIDSCVATAASLVTICAVAVVINWVCERVCGVEVAAPFDEPAGPQPRQAELVEGGDVTKEEEEKKLVFCPDWAADDEEEACASAASD
jgi:hypothetical protein